MILRRALVGLAALSAPLHVLGCAGDVESAPTASTGQALGTAVYVDCATGDDGAPGTSAAPVKTIRRAMALVQSGGEIDVRPGRCVERVDVTQSNITLQRDPATSGVVEIAGDSPIRVDSSDPSCNPWAPYPANYRCNQGGRQRFATIDLYDVHDVTIRNLTITQDQNAYCPAATATQGCIYDLVTPTGTTPWTQTFGAYFQQSCTIEPNPDGLQNRCEERATPNAGFSGLTSGCCVIPHATGPEEVVCNAPFGNPSTPDVLPPHVCGRPLVLAAGINVQGASYAIHIEGNDITHIKRGDRTKWISAAIPIIVNSRESDARVVRDVHIVGNTLHELPAHDIDGNTWGGLLVSVSDNVDGVEIANNVIVNVGGSIALSGNYAFADALGGVPPLSIDADRARNVWVHDNRITNASSYGIYLDGPRRVLIERNQLVDTWAGIGVVTEVRKDAPSPKDPTAWVPDPAHLAREVWVRDNLVVSTGWPIGEKPYNRPSFSAFVVGMWLTASDRPHYDPVANVAVTNNTFYLVDQTTTAPALRGTTTNFLPGVTGESPFRANVVAHENGSAMSLTTSSAPYAASTATLSWNDYWSTGGSAILRDLVATNPGGIGDGTGFVAAPLLNALYGITAGSPARNRVPTSALGRPSWATGEPFTNAERDVFVGPRLCGTRGDIGADEYSEWFCF